MVNVIFHLQRAQDLANVTSYREWVLFGYLVCPDELLRVTSIDIALVNLTLSFLIFLANFIFNRIEHILSGREDMHIWAFVLGIFFRQYVLVVILSCIMCLIPYFCFTFVDFRSY